MKEPVTPVVCTVHRFEYCDFGLIYRIIQFLRRDITSRAKLSSLVYKVINLRKQPSIGSHMLIQEQCTSHQGLRQSLLGL
jgi:hypothetical protein